MQIEYDYLSPEMNSYIDRFTHSTIEQALKIELYSIRIAEDIIEDALSFIADKEISARSRLINGDGYFRKTKKKSVQMEEQQQTSLFNQILCHSSTIARSNEKSIDSLVNTIAQQIYINSFNQLKS